MAAEAGVARALEKPPGPLAEKPGAAAPEAEPAAGESEEDAHWTPALALPCQMCVELPLPGFTVADLLRLRRGSVISARWRVGHDVSLLLNGTLIAWIQFELMGNNLAARLTELA